MREWKELISLAKEKETATVNIYINEKQTICKYGKKGIELKKEDNIFGIKLIMTALKRLSDQPQKFKSYTSYKIITHSPDIIDYLGHKISLTIDPVYDLDGKQDGIFIKMKLVTSTSKKQREKD